MKTEAHYGIDFGTSNTAIAANIEAKVQMIPLAKDGSYTVPSVLYFPPEGKIYKFGDEAVSEYLTRGMKGRFMQSLKSFLPEESFSGTYIPGFRHRSLDDLIAMIFAEVKKRADQYLGEDIRSAVIGIPAKLVNEVDDSSRKIAEERLRIAALKAGFKEISFRLEPTAAAYYYELTLGQSELVFIGDFGGGTSDFTIINLRPRKSGKIIALEDRTKDVLVTSGIPLAGNNFTSDIMKRKLLKYFGEGSKFSSWGSWLDIPVHILNQICKWENHAFMRSLEYRKTIDMLVHNSNDREGMLRLKDLIEENLGYALFQAIEKAKISISDLPRSNIVFSEKRIQIEESLTRGEFTNIIGYMEEKIDAVVTDMLHSSHINIGDINAVFLTGGSSATPLIKNYFESKFGKEKVKSKDNFTSVAQGLAS